MPGSCDWARSHDEKDSKLQQALLGLDKLLNRGTSPNPLPERDARRQSNLKTLDELLKKEPSHEMDKFIRLACESGYLAEYKAHFIIVRYHYVIKGVRMVVTDGNRQYPLPRLPGAYYWVSWGVQKYIDAGWEVEDRL